MGYVDLILLQIDLCHIVSSIWWLCKDNAHEGDNSMLLLITTLFNNLKYRFFGIHLISNYV